MENLKKFNTQEEYQEWKDGDDYVYPNVCKVGDEVIYNGYPEPFWIEALEDLTFSSESNNFISPDYSYDKLNWDKTYSTSQVLRSGQKVYFKSNDTLNGCHFKLKVNGRFNVGGSLLSVIYGSGYLNYLDYDFVSWASGMRFVALQGSKVVNAKELVLPSCGKSGTSYFSELFLNCSLLVSSPRIPKINNNMIDGMFKNCTSLQEAPTLKGKFYVVRELFYGCNSLSFIKDLTPTLSNMYTDNWVTGVSPTGTFIANSKRIDFTRGSHNIPVGWDLYLYDEDNDRYVVKFKVNDIPYEFYTDEPRDITWQEFINSDKNTNGFKVASTEFNNPVKFGSDYVLRNNEKVAGQSYIILNESYTIGQPTTTTEE